MSNDWIKLDLERLNPPQETTFRGAQITVRMSPYDVPEAVRGHWADEQRKTFVIEFRYLSGMEPMVNETTVDGAVTVSVGRVSQRLYRMYLKVEQIEGGRHGIMLDFLLNRADAAFQWLIESPQHTIRRDSYRAAQGAVHEHSAVLTQQI